MDTDNHCDQEWQSKLSQRGIATMPWDPPKPVPQPQHVPNGLPPSAYANFDPPQLNSGGGLRVKSEPGTEVPFSAYPPGDPSQGGLARAQHLVQQQYGQAAQRAGGLALPGQPHQNAKSQSMRMSPQSPSLDQTQHNTQAQMMSHQRQQMQAQNQPRIKVENDSPQIAQDAFQQSQQSSALPTYSQTDGADESALEQWRVSHAQRRALHNARGQEADMKMRERVVRMSSDLQSGLMVPLDGQRRAVSRKRKTSAVGSAGRVSGASSGAKIAQLDGDDTDDDDDKTDAKEPVRNEDDADAINSDLDDSDEDAKGPMDDEDDEFGDTILCTYDKVQRVKNKWKCTLKDGVMSVNGKEWVFHKGMGEFEW